MKRITVLLISVLCSFNAMCQLSEGTFLTIKSFGKEYLRIKIINDSTFIFCFTNYTYDFSFDCGNDFGVCHKRDNKWIGAIDHIECSDYRDFVDRKEGIITFGIGLEFEFVNKLVKVLIVESNSRAFMEGTYIPINKIPLSYTVRNNEINSYPIIECKVSKTSSLYSLPEGLRKKKEFISKGEIVGVINKYKEYILVVRYNKKKQIVKSGWVNRNVVSFYKYIEKR